MSFYLCELVKKNSGLNVYIVSRHHFDIIKIFKFQFDRNYL